MKKYKGLFELSIGDIIYCTKNYFVLGMNEGKIECLPLNISVKKYTKKFNRRLLEKIDYTRKVILDLDESNIHYLISLNKDLSNLILENYKIYQERQQIVKRGAVVLVSGQLYYIYSEEGQDFISFQLQNKPSDELERIIINGRVYYIRFDKIIKFNKKEEFEIKNLASEKEMLDIKELKKVCFENSEITNNDKINNLKVCKENLRPGTIFKLKHNEDQLVVLRVDSELVTYINQIYLDAVMNFQSITDLKCIDSIFDSSKETRERNKEKIKTLIDTYK